MQVNDKNMIYEISKKLPRSAQKDTEQIKDQPLLDQNKGQGADDTGQDAIVDFSTQVKEVEAIKNIIASQPDVRQDKVAEFKAKFESGEYRIDHDMIADKLVDSFLNEDF